MQFLLKSLHFCISVIFSDFVKSILEIFWHLRIIMKAKHLGWSMTYPCKFYWCIVNTFGDTRGCNFCSPSSGPSRPTNPNRIGFKLSTELVGEKLPNLTQNDLYQKQKQKWCRICFNVITNLLVSSSPQLSDAISIRIFVGSNKTRATILIGHDVEGLHHPRERDQVPIKRRDKVCIIYNNANT